MSDTQRSFLYVDDDPGSRHLIQLLMNAVLGYMHVTIFENSENFMERVRALPAVPDAVFLDVHIAPHDGYEMLKMLRGEPGYQKIPVIAMTASVMMSDLERLRTAGFNGLIGKPIKKKAFSDQLQKILAGESIWEVN
jgi:CheY-like chemotaxis protein